MSSVRNCSSWNLTLFVEDIVSYMSGLKTSPFLVNVCKNREFFLGFFQKHLISLTLRLKIFPKHYNLIPYKSSIHQSLIILATICIISAITRAWRRWYLPQMHRFKSKFLKNKTKMSNGKTPHVYNKNFVKLPFDAFEY